MGCMKPAVFLDRDGVLVKEKGYAASSADEMEIFPYAKECIDKIHEKGCLAIVITNQSGVARGLYTEDALKEMNELLIEKTGVDAVYYCPHHPDGKIEGYRCECGCRKPRTGMIEAACADFNISIKESYMAGDRAGDIKAGQNAGLKTALLESGYGTAGLEEAVTPDYICSDLREFVRIIGKEGEKL